MQAFHAQCPSIHLGTSDVELQCEMATASGISMLSHARLPPLCDETIVNISDRASGKSVSETNKFNPNSALCLGQLHPLEVLWKLGDLPERARPMLMVTGPGEVLVLPERWLHMTLNVEDIFTVAYRLTMIGETQCNRHGTSYKTPSMDRLSCQA